VLHDTGKKADVKTEFLRIKYEKNYVVQPARQAADSSPVKRFSGFTGQA
jgi:hypothetical protein